MKRLLHSAAYRIAFATAFLFAFAVAVLGVAVFHAADADFRRQQDESIVQESKSLIDQYQAEGVNDLKEAIATRGHGRTVYGFGYALFDRHGQRLAGKLGAPAAPPGWLNIGVRRDSNLADSARALVSRLSGGERLIVAADSDAVEALDTSIIRIFAIAFLVMLAFGAVGGLLLGGYLRRRLGRIGQTAEAVIAGKLDRRAPVGSSNDEFDQLALALNAMLDRIEILMENLRQLSSDVAHDLRTPLARMRSGLEEALTGPQTPGSQGQALEDAIARNDEILALFAAILRISEVEAGALERTFRKIDLSAEIADLCDTYRVPLSDSGRRLVCEIEPGAIIRGDRELVAQAVINLIDNAQAHTPIGTEVSLSLTSNATGPVLTVADNGLGVQSEDRDRIVRRFVRLDSSRSSLGHGLGLNLVSAIVIAHGGSMAIEDNAPGLRVALQFPALELRDN